MQDSKDDNWVGDYGVPGGLDSKVPANETESPVAPSAEVDGWQQYRRWISKAPTPRGHRTGVDPSLYTWKGYRNWTEQIKRNWSDS